MNILQHLSDLDPLTNLACESSLPPEPLCASLSDVLELTEPRLGNSLIDSVGKAALHSIAAQIPAMLSPFWGLEIRLGGPAPRADFLWEVVQENADVLTFAGRDLQDRDAQITNALLERSPFWREISCFAEEWLDRPDWLELLGNIWLEADTASATGAVLEACLDRPNLFWGPNRRTADSDLCLLRRLGALGRRFYGLDLDLDKIEALIDSIPTNSFVFQMGVMGARSTPIIRLCVKNPDTDVQERWLSEIGWPGDMVSLHRYLVQLKPLCSEIALNVDFLPDCVGEKLGIEVYAAERMLSLDTWKPINDKLFEQGLARAEKLAALEDFPWAERFNQMGAWRRTPPVGFPLLVTNLHHLKLVFVGDAVTEAKAYLGVFRPFVNYSRANKGNIAGGGWL